MGFLEKMNAFERFIDMLAPVVSLNTFFDAISDGVDERIRNSIRSGLVFLGGKTHFSLSANRKEIQIDSEVYYEAEGNYEKQEFSGRFWFSRINTDGQQEFYNMLDENGVLTIEIEAPQEDI